MSAPEDERISVRVDPELGPLIPAYLEKRRVDVQRLREALTTGDMDTVESIGHILKGSGGGYGFVPLSRLGGDLERAAVEGDAERAAARVEEIADYLARIDVEYGPPTR